MGTAMPSRNLEREIDDMTIAKVSLREERQDCMVGKWHGSFWLKASRVGPESYGWFVGEKIGEHRGTGPSLVMEFT